MRCDDSGKQKYQRHKENENKSTTEWISFVDVIHTYFQNSIRSTYSAISHPDGCISLISNII